MSFKWLAVGAVGTLVLALGFWMAIAKRPQFYPGLIMVLGALFLIVFLWVNEAAWASAEEPAVGQRASSGGPADAVRMVPDGTAGQDA